MGLAVSTARTEKASGLQNLQKLFPGISSENKSRETNLTVGSYSQPLCLVGQKAGLTSWHLV